MSESRNNFYFREDGKSVLVEFQHGMTDYKTVGRITFCPGHPGSMFCFEQVAGHSDGMDFSIRADDLFAILNKLAGNKNFPPKKEILSDEQPTQVIKMPAKCGHCDGKGETCYPPGPYEVGSDCYKCEPCGGTGFKKS